MIKKLLGIVLALVMVFSLAACSDTSNDNTEENTTAAEAESEIETEEEFVAGEVVETVVWTNDGETNITDAAFDEYFEGTAEEGIEILMNAGLVAVNGIALPMTEDETTDYQVNGVSSIYKTDSGWGYNVHKTTSADNLSFDTARTEFLQVISTVRGHTMTLGLDENGYCVSVDITSYDAVRILRIDEYNEYRSIGRGDFELETTRTRPDVATLQFLTVNFDENVAVGDIAIYWYASDGWHLEKADAVEGTLSKDDDGNFVINGDDVRTESNVSRYNLINCNRPTQFYTAYSRMGLGEISVTTWCTSTGNPIGFTYGDNAKTALALAIENAEAAKEGVEISTDGSDVPNGTMWVTQESMDEFDEAIETAQSVLNSNLSSAFDLDNAIYELSTAYGESGDNPSGFIGAQGEGQQ